MSSILASAPPASGTRALPAVPWEWVDKFIGQFTHDLRNGLNALELQLTLLSELNQDATLAEDIVAMRTTLNNLSREMQAVRTAAGPVAPNPIPYPAGDLLEDLRERQEKRAAGTFRWDFAPEVSALTLDIDPELLLAALLHLLGNALRFRETKDSALTFAARLADPKTGAASRGLSLELTEAKSTALPTDALADWGTEPLRTTRRGSYGLGLFHARRVIEAMGGTLRAAVSSTNSLPSLVTTIWLPAVLSDGAPA